MGVVWTDGAGQVGVEATDVDGLVLFSFGPASDETFPDSSITGTTAEDRFFGVAASVGIKTLRLYNTSGGIEVDHFQFGRER